MKGNEPKNKTEERDRELHKRVRKQLASFGKQIEGIQDGIEGMLSLADEAAKNAGDQSPKDGAVMRDYLALFNKAVKQKDSNALRQIINNANSGHK